MFLVELDVTEFDLYAQFIEGGVRQLPFVYSQLLNDAAFKARQVLTETTWPRHVHVRNANFLTASLHVTKATKQDLHIEINDTLQRGHLQQQARGGTATPYRAQRFAIPIDESMRSAMGPTPWLTPQRIIDRTPKRALRITPRGLFVGEHGRLHLKYSFARTINIPSRVPFYEDFEYTVSEAVRTEFVFAFDRALEGKRR